MATIFFDDLFGREYNEVEMERIVLREMKDITVCFSELLKNGENNELQILRKLSGDAEIEKLPPESIFMSEHRLKPRPSPKSDDSDKLFCSICLEEINSETISILCGHYFHCQCLERWEFNTCPLCRYHQQPPVISFCEQCNQCEGLWVCLICGRRLCCGSTNDILGEDSHIYQHYKEVSHSLSMELETKFLFDARVPAFLHQMFYRDLITKGVGFLQEQAQEKEDSKKNKLSDKISHYENQVADEMHKQRTYFETQIGKKSKTHRDEIYRKKEKLTSLQREMARVNGEIEQLQKDNEQLAVNL